MKSLVYISAVSMLVALGAYGLSGCSAVGCTENQNSVPLAGFYSSASGKAVNLSGIAVGGVGAPADSLLLGSATQASQCYLPFRSTKQSTSFYILYKQLGEGVTDTITFDYESIPFFASEECGAMYHYRITGVSHTTHVIDSVGLTDSTVTNVERETIKIYFRTNEAD